MRSERPWPVVRLCDYLIRLSGDRADQIKLRCQERRRLQYSASIGEETEEEISVEISLLNAQLASTTNNVVLFGSTECIVVTIFGFICFIAEYLQYQIIVKSQF